MTSPASFSNPHAPAPTGPATKAFYTDPGNPGHRVTTAREVANQIQKKMNKVEHQFTLVRWMNGHAGIEGNQGAIPEANLAACRKSPDKPSYPRCALTINPSAAKEDNNTELSSRWENEWYIH